MDVGRVGFTLREHAFGTCCQILDRVVVRLFKVFTPEHPNPNYQALYHRNCGYTLAEIFDNEDEVGDSEN